MLGQRQSPGEAAVQRAVLAEFQVRGLPVTADAAAAIAAHIASLALPPRRRAAALARIADRCTAATATLADGVVDLQAARGVLADLADARSSDLAAHRVAVVPSAEAPRLVYDAAQKAYRTELPAAGTGLFAAHFGPASDKVLLFRRRYDLVRQRLLRDVNFGEGSDSSCSAFASFITTTTAAPTTPPPPPSSGFSESQSEDAGVSSLGSNTEGRNTEGRNTEGGGSFEAQRTVQRLNLTTVEALTGSSGHHCVLGFVAQTAAGGWALEDPTAAVPLAFAPGVRRTDGLFTECGLVLATGAMADGVFVVDTVGQPVPEPRERTLRALGPRVDAFGRAPPPAVRAQLQRAAAAADALVLVLSDVALDSPRTLDALARLLQECCQVDDDGDQGDANNSSSGSTSVPQYIVLMGTFVSKRLPEEGDGTGVVALYERLARILSGTSPRLARTHFVFVPGPGDPCGTPGGPLPRARLPEACAAPLVARLGARAHFGDNPCRARFGMRECVLFRDDALAKMQRHCVLAPERTDTPALAHHLARTVCGQGHLAPLPLAVTPVHWGLDHCLALCPLPHLCVVADRVAAYALEYTGCLVVNPGSFARARSFILYSTAQHTATVCSLDDPSTAPPSR